MKLRAFAIRLFIRIYPAAWRREFGAEFEDLLHRCPLNPLALVNVFVGGIGERVIDLIRRMAGGGEVAERRFGARYDGMTKIISGFTVALLIAVSVGAIRAGVVAAVVAFVSAAVIGLSFAFSPRGYQVSGGIFRVKRPVGDVVFPLERLRFMRDATAADFWGSVRLWGSGGVFGYYGWFWSKALGRSRWYVTDHNKALVLTDGNQVILVSPEDRQEFLNSISPDGAGGAATSAGFLRSVPTSRARGFAITGFGLALAAAAMLYSPGRPRVDLARESLVIHSRFFGMTVAASSIDVPNVRVVDLQIDPGWKPILRVGGIGNSFYRAGNFRTANGRTVKLFTTGTRRLVLLPPAGVDGTPVLLDVAAPDEFAARLRQEWTSR